MILLHLALAALPPLGLMIFFYLKDRYEPEPHGHVALAFMKGIEAMLIAYALSWALGRVVGDVWLALGGLPARLFEGFVLAGAVEEFAKWWTFLTVIYHWDEFDEPLDGVIYGVALALGLATVENILVVLRQGFSTGILRAIFTVPAHALTGATMGYFFGRAKLGNGRRGSEVARADRLRRGLYALLVPIAFHGAFDFGVLELRPLGNIAYLGIGLLSLGVWVLVLRALDRAREDSPFRKVQDQVE